MADGQGQASVHRSSYRAANMGSGAHNECKRCHRTSKRKAAITSEPGYTPLSLRLLVRQLPRIHRRVQILDFAVLAISSLVFPVKGSLSTALDHYILIKQERPAYHEDDGAENTKKLERADDRKASSVERALGCREDMRSKYAPRLANRHVHRHPSRFLRF